MRIKNRKQFAHRIDLWDDDGANLVDHLAGVEDLDVAAATYRAACRRWPKAKITLRQGARVVDKSWRDASPNDATVTERLTDGSPSKSGSSCCGPQ